MDLNNLLSKLKHAHHNQIEYYERGVKKARKFTQVYTDTCKAVALLSGLGLRKGDRVGIQATNCYEWIVVDLACLVQGVVTIPLETTKRYDGVLNGFGLQYVFTNLEKVGDTGYEGKVLSFAEITRRMADSPEAEMAPYGEEDVFTVISTSGTSSKSKFIEVKKRSFDHLVTRTNELFGFVPSDRFMVFLPLSIYLERCYVYAAVLTGFDILLTPLEYIFHSIQHDKPTVIIGIPYFFESFHDKFLEKVNGKAAGRVALRLYGFLRKKGLGFLFGHRFPPFVTAWGGNIRYLLTGAARIRQDTLQFYQDMGITLYEGYGLSEIGGMVALNAPGRVKLGSVGKPFPGKEIIIDPKGQILVESKYLANDRYLVATPQENEKTYLAPGLVATGDLGYLDDEGFLFINGRMKDLIITSNGKKIHPTQVEEVVINSGLFSNCAVYGDNKPHLVALVVPKNKNATREELRTKVNELNGQLAGEQKIVNFFLLKETFSVENKMLTNTLKMNRAYIYKKYEHEIENLYN